MLEGYSSGKSQRNLCAAMLRRSADYRLVPTRPPEGLETGRCRHVSARAGDPETDISAWTGGPEYEPCIGSGRTTYKYAKAGNE